MNNDIRFCITVMDVLDGKKLKALKPDKDGYYRGVPVAVIGLPTRNTTFYDPSSFQSAMDNPKSPINIYLKDGQLYSEWGHPRFFGKKMTQNEQLQRVCDINMDRISGHYYSIYAAETIKGVGTVIRADLMPTGPNGQYLEEQLRSPYINSAWSLRSICSEKPHSKYRSYRTIKVMVTFDNVPSGGYQQASKRWVDDDIVATESLDIGLDFTVPAVDDDDLDMSYEVDSNLLLTDSILKTDDTVVAVEEVKNLDILDVFNAKYMEIHDVSVGVQLPDNSNYIDQDGELRSGVHVMLGQRSKLRRK